MLKQLNDDAILEAFHGDFGEIYFDHKPTPDDMLLIKLKLVTREAERYRAGQIVEWGDELCTTREHGWALSLKKRECRGCWQELKKEEI